MNNAQLREFFVLQNQATPQEIEAAISRKVIAVRKAIGCGEVAPQPTIAELRKAIAAIRMATSNMPVDAQSAKDTHINAPVAFKRKKVAFSSAALAMYGILFATNFLAFIILALSPDYEKPPHNADAGQRPGFRATPLNLPPNMQVTKPLESPVTKPEQGSWRTNILDLRPYSEEFGREITRLQYAQHHELSPIIRRMEAIQSKVEKLTVEPCLRRAVFQFSIALDAIAAAARGAELGNGVGDPSIVPMMLSANNEVAKARVLMASHSCDKG